MNENDIKAIQKLQSASKELQSTTNELYEDLATLYLAIWFMGFSKQVFHFVYKLMKREREELK